MSEASESDDTAPMLNEVEARVLGVLMEKQRTTPDNYPMTLNALIQGCNQKTSRIPVMNLEAGGVGHTLGQLRDRNLLHASFSGRAERYDHKMVSTLGLDRQEQAVLCVLMLRGPQTQGELRTNAARMAEFADLNAVHEVLDRLMTREPPVVKRLPKSSGRREERFAHLLCGDIEYAEVAEGAPTSGSAKGGRVTVLEQEVSRLRSELDLLWQLTGLADKKPPSDA